MVSDRKTGRAIGIDDVLNVELINDNLKKFDEAWEEFLMGLEKVPEADLFECMVQLAEGETLTTPSPGHIQKANQ